MSEHDTIAAISTAQGTGAIGIVRMSGDKAFEIAERIFSGKKSFSEIKSHSVSYGKIIDPEGGEVIDEVLLIKMKGPKTFTTEDTVEINCHGGTVVLRKILELAIREGARLAEPGEFTKRAFINGRIDLSQAEAVIDLINSKTEMGSKAAMEQLEGKLSQKIKSVRKKLIELIAHIEASVDYPEYDIEEITGREVYNTASRINEELKELLKSFDRGRIIREGVNVIITGRPNSGKSSLLNELSGKNRAIVTDIPGTTRDIIEEYVNMNGIPVRLVDTAGIRETSDPVERIGVEIAQKAIKEADILILMIDSAVGPGDDDFKILSENEHGKIIVILNKTDLVDECVLSSYKRMLNKYPVVEMSIIQGKGVDKLEKMLDEIILKDGINQENQVLLTNVRHKDLVEKAVRSIDDACMAFKMGMPLDCMTIDIRNAAEYLGQITGESISEDVANKIFARFCIGK